MAYPTEQQIKRANKIGLQHAKSGQWVCWWNAILDMSYNLGQDGIDLDLMPIVDAHRWGSIPDNGISINHVTDTKEHGCSCAWLDDNPSNCYGYMTQASGADCVLIRGVLVPDTGSDGEPLVLLIGDGVEFN